MPNNYLSVLYKHIIQVEIKNVGLKVCVCGGGGGGGRTNIPLPPQSKKCVCVCGGGGGGAHAHLAPHFLRQCIIIIIIIVAVHSLLDPTVRYQSSSLLNVCSFHELFYDAGLRDQGACAVVLVQFHITLFHEIISTFLF